MIALMVDPSINKPAAAVFDTSQCRPRTLYDTLGYFGAAYGFVGVHGLRLRGAANEVEKCALLAAWLAGLIERVAAELKEAPALVVIETPYMAGTYYGRKKRQRTKGSITAAAEAKLNQAIGALQLTARQAGCEVVTVPCRYPLVHKDKRFRHEFVNSTLRQAGKDELVRGASSEDERDAVYLGLHYLCQVANDARA